MLKALLVDDDVDHLDLLTYTLRREGYTVLTAINGAQTLQACEVEPPDIVVLDVTLPKLDGFEICRRLRQTSELPIIMLTARNDEAEILRGLQLGADDYVTKPYRPKELAARMKTVLRRCQTKPGCEPVKELVVGDLRLDLQSQEVTKAGQVVQLTRLEFRILYLLAMNAGRVVPYTRLVEFAWGYSGDYDSRDAGSLKSHICHLRRKLNFRSAQPEGIQAITGVGYSLARARAN